MKKRFLVVVLCGLVIGVVISAWALQPTISSAGSMPNQNTIVSSKPSNPSTPMSGSIHHFDLVHHQWIVIEYALNDGKLAITNVSLYPISDAANWDACRTTPRETDC